VLGDNWYATERSQLDALEAAGARVETVDVRDRDDVERLVSERPDRVYLLAAQASRPISERDPEYTEATNVTGARIVAETVAVQPTPVIYASSLHVYGSGLRGEITPEHPYGPQRDLAHLSKIYAELVLRMHAERAGFDLELLRLGIVYGPSPVEHAAAESQTVVDKFKRLAAEGRDLTVDDEETMIGTVHVDDAARILLEAPHGSGVSAANVVADTVSVGDVARLARGEAATALSSCRYTTPFRYDHRLGEYLG
jgi:UDP-glucose 4-epimerase